MSSASRGPAPDGSAWSWRPGGERSFVTDRGAALRLAPADLKADWFGGADLLHLTVYSLLGSPLADSGASGRSSWPGRPAP